ncbi:MAG: YtxH domain-containing protein [Chloroflexi bacterium]|nr:YtxH domain-containing protein [Chloroflexota bacterium]
MCANNDAASKFGAGLILGTAIGLAVGFLYAPHSGKETREVIIERAEKARERAEYLAEKARQRAEELAVKAKQVAPKVGKKQEEAY